MELQNINSDTYVIAVDNTSKSATLVADYGPTANVICYNGSDQAVFITSGITAPTAVFPTSASVPVKGQIIAPWATMTYELSQGHRAISAIQAVAGTGSLYITAGEGV